MTSTTLSPAMLRALEAIAGEPRQIPDPFGPYSNPSWMTSRRITRPAIDSLVRRGLVSTRSAGPWTWMQILSVSEAGAAFLSPRVAK